MSQFGRYPQNSYSYQYSNNNSYSNNYNNYRSNSNNYYGSTNPKIGSYRCRDYDTQKLPSNMCSLEQWKQFIPMSMTLREQTMHLSPIELRAEDYYLIRTKNLEERHRKNLQSQWVNKNLFNTNLFSNDAMATIKQVLSFKEGPPSFDAIANMSKGGGNRYNSNSYGKYEQNNNNNMYNSGNHNDNIGNPFTSNNNTTNMFNTNNTNNSYNNNNTNNSTYNTRSNSANPFSSNTNNPFSSNNNNINNTSNNNTNYTYGNRTNSSTNNPFNNTNKNNIGSNSNTNNLFSNNNMFSNNSNNSNPFNNNNNNNNNSNNNNSNNMNRNNLFSNNSNNNNNPFSSNNNNNSSNNMYNNNKTNNLFSNTNNNNNNNNPFNNNNNNNNNINNSGYGIISEYTILQMMNMMQTCIDKALNNNNMGSLGNSNSNNGQLFGMGNSTNNSINDNYYFSNNANRKYQEWFREPFELGSSNTGYGVDDYIQAKAKNKKKMGNKTYVVIKQDNNSRIISNNDGKNTMGTSLLPNNHNKNNSHCLENKKNWNLWEGEGNSRVYTNANYHIGSNQNGAKNENEFMTQYNKLSSKDSIEQTQQYFDDNHDTSKFKSIPQTKSNLFSNSNPTTTVRNNKQEDNIYQNNSKPKIISGNHLNVIKYKYRVQCIWAENLRRSTHDSAGNVEDYLIESELMFKYNPGLSELHDVILEDIMTKYSSKDGNGMKIHCNSQIIIRKDATLTLQMPMNTSRNEYFVKGTVLQNKINVQKGYDYIYDGMDGWQVKNLTIVNRFGRIQWPGVINIKGTDFQDEIQILENQGDVRGVLDTYDMIVTFNSLPPGVAMDLNDEKRAKKQMERHIKKVMEATKDNIVLVNLDLKNKSYTFKVEKITNLGEDNQGKDNEN